MFIVKYRIIKNLIKLKQYINGGVSTFNVIKWSGVYIRSVPQEHQTTVLKSVTYVV